MNRNHNRMQIVTSVFMIVALLWLSVSTPFVFHSQQALKKTESQKQADKTASADDGNPFSSTTEEKSENTNISISEYLHDPFEHERGFTLITSFRKCHPDDLYLAFHPESVSPPPKA